MQQSPFATGVEKIIAEVNTKGSKVTRKERDIFLVAVTGESLSVRNPDICFGQTDCGLRFLEFRASRKDLRMRRLGSRNAVLAAANFFKLGNSRIKIQSRCEWQADQVVEL